MQKRGLSNIEFILSFVLFIGFVVSAIYFFNPIRDVQVLESSKSYVMGELTRNVTIMIDSYSVKIMPEAKDNSNGGIIAVNIPGINIEKKVRTEDYYGNVIESWRDGDNVYFNVTKDSGMINFTIIKFGEDFKAGEVLDKPSLDTRYYKIASSNTGESADEVMSEKRLLLLNESYYEDYMLLKKELGIPTDVDFAFELEFPNTQKISAIRSIPLRAEVFAETKIREALKEDGTTEFANFMVKIW